MKKTFPPTVFEEKKTTNPLEYFSTIKTKCCNHSHIIKSLLKASQNNCTLIMT